MVEEQLLGRWEEELAGLATCSIWSQGALASFLCPSTTSKNYVLTRTSSACAVLLYLPCSIAIVLAYYSHHCLKLFSSMSDVLECVLRNGCHIYFYRGELVSFWFYSSTVLAFRGALQFWTWQWSRRRQYMLLTLWSHKVMIPQETATELVTCELIRLLRKIDPIITLLISLPATWLELAFGCRSSRMFLWFPWHTH